MKEKTKTRNWAGIFYEESAPADWREVIADMHIPTLVSPLHDKDIDESGKKINPHRHIVIIADGPITQKRANEILAPLNGTKSAEYVKSLKGYTRYLAHLDNPEKAPYDPEDIEAFSGADLEKLLNGSTASSCETVGEIIDFCTDNNITEFCSLVEYTRSKRPKDWFPIVIKNAFLLSRYITSKRHSAISKTG